MARAHRGEVKAGRGNVKLPRVHIRYATRLARVRQAVMMKVKVA